MFSPAGHALLHGGSRSTYSGRIVRHEPVWFARLEPGSSVMANGLLMLQPVTADIAVRDCLDPRDHIEPHRLAEQVGKAFLRPQVLFHRSFPADFRDRGDFAVL